jgi:cold shock CspA family protein
LLHYRAAPHAIGGKAELRFAPLTDSDRGSPGWRRHHLSRRRNVMKSRTNAFFSTLTAIGAGVLLWSGGAFAAPGVEDSEVNSARGQTRSQLIRTTASIVGIDNIDRSVLLKSDDGSQTWVHVPASIEGFDHLKMGDRVNVDFYQSLAISLAPSGSKPSMSATQAGAVDRGAGVKGRELRVSATVVSVDPAAETVTFKGPKGRLSTVNVEDPALQARLPTLKPGQVVQFDYVEAVAADLRPAS